MTDKVADQDLIELRAWVQRTLILDKLPEYAHLQSEITSIIDEVRAFRALSSRIPAHDEGAKTADLMRKTVEGDKFTDPRNSWERRHNDLCDFYLIRSKAMSNDQQAVRRYQQHVSGSGITGDEFKYIETVPASDYDKLAALLAEAEGREKKLTQLLSAFAPRQREYIETLVFRAEWRITSVTLSREGDKPAIVGVPASISSEVKP